MLLTHKNGFSSPPVSLYHMLDDHNSGAQQEQLVGLYLDSTQEQIQYNVLIEIRTEVEWNRVERIREEEISRAQYK
jgi:hypothetical protein